MGISRTGDDEVEVLVLDVTDCDTEGIDAFQNEEFGPGAAEVADSIQKLQEPAGTFSSRASRRKEGKAPAKSAERCQKRGPAVMYVPPINGSAIWVWNAEIPTNCTVLCGHEE